MKASANSRDDEIEVAMDAKDDGGGGIGGGIAHEEYSDEQPPPLELKTVSWFRQFYFVFRKNFVILSRRPVLLTIMLLSSVVSIVLGWLLARPSNKAIYGPLNSCGILDANYIDSKNSEYDILDNMQFTLNDRFRSGFAVAIFAVGPMLNAVCAFLLVHDEFANQLIGVLRALGLRDSVFWLSWFVVLMSVNTVNAALGTIMTRMLPLHAFETIYAAGIFASLFFLHLALVSASFFLTALMGSAKRGVIWMVLIILIGVWITPIILSAQSSWPFYAYDIGSISERPAGFFWLNQATNTDGYIEQNTTFRCNQPIMSEKQGKWYKTEAERALVQDDEFFVGCFFTPSWHAAAWQKEAAKNKLVLAVHFMFPYFHFAGMWSNFVGYTSMPGTEFTASEFGKSPEELAVASLPVPPSSDNAFTSKLAPQGSTFFVGSYEEEIRYDPSRTGLPPSQCPLSDREGAGLCEYMRNCKYIENGGPTQDSPSAADSMMFLIVNAIIYALVAAYWAQVLPGMNGKAAKPYFFLLPSYWLGSKSSTDEQSNSNRNQILVNNVRKAYGQFEAVKGVSMTMNRGEVTAFLGHNGAGKTTLSHVISCEIAPTEGDVTVFGTSVTDDPFAVRNMVGLCKQDDYLWNNLSAKEHLELFAGLRGVPNEDMDATVQKWLESVDLAAVQLQYSSSFSGGMKRRLSVALATIGERPLIILDEPTTGMDPVSRRFVWRHIDEIKANRVIILTTHAMEEADLLAEEVAIMKKGDLAAFGSPLELKTQHGSALQFTLLVEREDVEATSAHLQEFFADAGNNVSIAAPPTGNIIVNIHKIDNGEDGDDDDKETDTNANTNAEESNGGISVNRLSEFVAWLDGDKSLVQEYGFSNSSLEEIFLKVTGEETLVNEETPAAPANGQTRNEEEEARITAAADPNRLTEIAGFKPSLTTLNQVRALFGFYFRRNWIGRSSISNYIVYGILMVILIWTGLGANEYDNRGVLAVPTIVISLMLVGLCGIVYADRAENLFHLMRTQGLLPRSFLLGITSYAFVIQFVFAFIVLTILFLLPIFGKQSVCPENAYDCYPGFGESPKVSTWELATIEYEDTVDDKPVVIRAYRQPGGYGGIFALIIAFTLSAPGAVLSSSFLPGYKISLVFVAFVCVLAGLAPLVYFFVGMFESERKYESCMEDFLDYFDKPMPTLEDDETLAEKFCNGPFNKTNIDEFFVNCAGVQVNELSQYCTPMHTALLPQFGIFTGLSMIYTGKIAFESDPQNYIEDVLMPNLKGADCSGSTCEFKYANKLLWSTILYMVLGSLCLTVLGLIMTFTFAFPNSFVLKIRMHISHALGRLMGTAPNSRRGNNGQTDEAESAPFAEVQEESNVVREIVQGFVTVTNDEDGIETGDAVKSVTVNHDQIPRDDVPPVLTHKLCKTYPALGGRPPKKALDMLDLQVPRGQCLGFLGKNGAGKTTALKILAGAHDPTHGFGMVSGYDSALERISVFERLGNCPQFDVVWATQSVGTHLEFFARLKGLPGNQVKEVARAIAEAVGLGSLEVYSRNAGALSGGMRRRLSIAMSLIGSPSVLILDEPTTGLDPSTRNNIWGLINSFNSQERSTIITTHMMIEADTLCNRIAIISDGKLKVIGSQQHLKDKYGSGYLLQLNLVRSNDEAQENAMRFIQKHVDENAVVATRQVKTLHINLPRNLDLGRVFRALYSQESKTEGGINQFLLSQSSLEDVFIALGD
mmetsp:Transcript_9216/g.26324  ORF Transcript_9216/g.26324 Transcript_9216/m.26324 type:complete len:1722 (+) Transcript_9216:124-5289(+)